METQAALLLPFAVRALDAIGREYPSHVVHLLHSDHDARPPRELTPVFFGSFDWHSAVHGHWCLVRCLRAGLTGEVADRSTAALERSFDPEKLVREAHYVAAPGRAGFERPYGLAWVLQLAAELREWESPRAFGWHDALRPLERLAIDHLSAWLPRLRWPIRSGEHSQSAFALGLTLDWAQAAGDLAARDLIMTRARELYGDDVDAPVAYEPSGHDFLSPVLAEADLMRRVLEPAAFVGWFERFLPALDGAVARRWLTPVETLDRADGKLAHLDGLNLSRAWMLEGIAGALPAAHRVRAELEAAGARHRDAGLAAARGTDHYAGTHWLGSFAVYLLTRRGLGQEFRW